MPRLTARLLTALALVATVAGCGAGEDTPKRTVDPLDEALRFFPVDAEAVILVRPDRGAFHTLGEVAHRVSPTLSPVPDFTIPLRAVAPPGQVAELTAAEQGPASRIAVGAASTRQLFGDGGLAVLVSDRAEDLERLVARAARRGRMRPAGEHHEARLYRGPGFAIAERDGVLLIGDKVDAVRAAIDTRDGDRDEHLDDRAAEDAIDELPETAPVLVFLDMRAIAAGRAIPPELERVGWLDSLRHAAVAARPAPGGVALQVFGDGDGADLGETIDDRSLERLPPTVRPLGTPSVAGDELRAELLLRR
jgi:hypothetical protein